MTGRHHRCSEESRVVRHRDIVEAIRAVAVILGKAPSLSQYTQVRAQLGASADRSAHLPSAAAATRGFGSWATAIKAANLDEETCA